MTRNHDVETLAEELATAHAIDPETFAAALALAGIFAPVQTDDTEPADDFDPETFTTLFDIDGRAF